MTDRGRAALRTCADRFEVGPSRLTWTGEALRIDVDEWGGPPFFGRIRGTITLTPDTMTGVEVPLGTEAHIWRPFAPLARISVDLDAPGWQWEGEGYFDANFGKRPLEQDFATWTWAAYPHAEGASVFYDLAMRDGRTVDLAFDIDKSGLVKEVAGPPKTRFARSLWQVARSTRADLGTTPKQTLNMLDAPFYSRAAVATTLNGTRVEGVHEALDLRRYRNPFLKPMIAVRVPRRAGWRFPK